MKRKRDYKQEYLAYYGNRRAGLTKKQALHRKHKTSRNRARALTTAMGLTRKNDGKDVDHKDGNPLNNSPSNLRILPRSRNRSIK